MPPHQIASNMSPFNMQSIEMNHAQSVSEFNQEQRMMMSNAHSLSNIDPRYHQYSSPPEANAFSQAMNLCSAVTQHQSTPRPLRQQPSRSVKANRYNTPAYQYYTQNAPLPPKKKTAWMKFAQSFERIVLPENTMRSMPSSSSGDHANYMTPLSDSQAIGLSSLSPPNSLPSIHEEKQSTSRSTGDEDDDSSSDDDDEDDEDQQDFALFHDFPDQEYGHIPSNDQEAEEVLNSFVESLTDPVGKVRKH